MRNTFPVGSSIDPSRRKTTSLSSLRRFFPFIVLGAVVWLTCFSALNNSELIDDIDEGRYATIARQMVDSGDWVVPHVGQEVFLEKPPLLFWSQAIFIRILGPKPVSARLPSAIAAALTALLLCWWSGRNGHIRAGLLAAIFYLLCPLTLGMASMAMMDSLLALWLTLAAIGWIEGYQGRRSGYLVWAIAAAFACLTKGLVGCLLPAAAFVIWCLMRRDAGEWRRVPWLAVGSLFLIIALPWHLLIWHSQGQAFIQEYIVRQQLQRFLGRGFTYSSPLWYYVAELLLGMFPWVVFSPAALWVGLRAGRHSRKSEINCAAAMWAVWALVILVFFSLSQTKLPQYLLPVLPALCMLVAIRLETAWRNRLRLSTGEAIALGVTGLVLGGLFVFAFVVGRQMRTHSAVLAGTSAGAWLTRERESVFLTLFTSQWLVLGILVLLSTVVMLFYWQKISRVVTVSIVTNSILAMMVLHSALPVWSRQRIAPVNDLGRRTLPALERGEYLVIYEAISPPPYRLRFQLGHPEQIKAVVLRHELPPALERLQHGYVIAPQKAVFNPQTVELHQEAVAGSWILWRFDRRE